MVSRVEGADEVAAAFHQAALVVGHVMGGVVEATAKRVVLEAQRQVPKRRTQLAKSITHEMVGDLEAEIGPENQLGGGYGHIVEKGLAGRRPQPFLNPALDLEDRPFEQAVREATRQVI